MSTEPVDRTPEEMSEYIKNQAPLNNVYESSDFVQGINRGKFLESTRIIKLLEENNTCDGGISTGTCFCEAIDFLKGKK